MNEVQKEIALAIGKHFARQDMTTHRDGPVERIEKDQNMLLADLLAILRRQNPTLDEAAFSDALVSGYNETSRAVWY